MPLSCRTLTNGAVPTIRIIAPFALALLSGCAAYHRAPLHDPDVVLARPDTAVLSTDTSKIDRPYLKPEAIDLSLPLTPNALAIIAVLENPDLKALRLKSGVADAQVFAARLLPDPTVQGSFDKILSGPDPLNGFGGQIGFDIGALRARHVTPEGARAARQQVRLDLAWAEWQTAGAARIQGTRVLALIKQLELGRVSVASAESLLARTQNAVGRGDVAGADADTRRLAALDASDKLRLLERDLTAAQLELNKTLGLPPGAVLHLAPIGDPIAPPVAEMLSKRAVAERLDLAALRAGYDAAESVVHKAVLDQFPNLSLTLIGARDTAGNYTAGPQIGFTLPFFNRNRGGIALAQASRAQLQAEYDARLFQTRAEIATTVATLRTIRRQQAQIRSALPPLERFVAASARAARRGDLARATAETAAQTLRDRHATLLMLDQSAAEATIALELLSGAPSETWSR